MHLSRIDVNLLVVFDTVYTEGGITMASRKLNLSQPAVSHALGRLRDLLGDPLFERQGRGVAATPLARSIAGPIREALRTLQRTLGEAGSFDAATSERQFRVGMSPALEATVLAPLTVMFCALAPRSDLVSLRLDRRRLARDLAAGEVDVAIDILLPLADSVPHERVMLDRLVVIAREDHPALRRLRRGAWNLETYLEQQHILVSSRRQGPGSKTWRCDRWGIATRAAALPESRRGMPRGRADRSGRYGARDICPHSARGRRHSRVAVAAGRSCDRNLHVLARERSG